MRKIVASESKPVSLGRFGENEATVVEFDVADWEETFGAGGEFYVWAKRNGDPAFYPCEVTCADGKVLWVIRSSDVAIPGFGLCGLIYRFGSDGTAKSVIYTTYVNESVAESSDVPDVWESWVETVLQAAEAADAAVSHYPYIDSDTHHWMRWDSTLSAFSDTGVVADSGCPQKGIDYFTDAEIEEITQQIAEYLSAPMALSQLQSDADHRTVSDSEKASWSGKYTKPLSGIPASDMAAAVRSSLGKADSAVQTESDPTVPSWAKQAQKPTYTASEVGLGNVDNVRQYSASNPPPYPVSSVNGKTGSVEINEVPNGGNVNQVLTKTSQGYAWANAQGGGGSGGSGGTAMLFAIDTLSAGNTNTTVSFIGTPVSVIIKDAVTGEEVLADIVYAANSVTVSIAAAYTNNLTVTVAYSAN